MKVRSGFVSNSSSSSFILKLQKIDTRNDLKVALFGEDCPPFVTDWSGDSFATGQIIDIVYKDIRNAIKNNSISTDPNNMCEDISVYEYTLNDYDNLVKEEYRIDYNKLKVEYKIQMSIIEDIRMTDEYQELDYFKGRHLVEKDTVILDGIGDKMKEIIVKSISDDTQSNDKYLTLEYSDNDGQIFSFIEHSDVLDPITVTKISNH
jgi:hypothetical protein